MFVIILLLNKCFTSLGLGYSLTRECLSILREYNYDNTKKATQDIIDMPDRFIDLFIQLCLQNNGRLSAKKRFPYFDFLTDDELTAMQQAVRNGYNRFD